MDDLQIYMVLNEMVIVERFEVIKKRRVIFDVIYEMVVVLVYELFFQFIVNKLVFDFVF